MTHASLHPVRWAVTWLTFCVLTVSCTTQGPTAPVVDVGAAPDAADSSRYHIVARGETLYAIAFRVGIDHKSLARINRVDAPYTIFPGQQLALSPASGGSVTQKLRPVSTSRNKSAARVRKPAERRIARSQGVQNGWRWPVSGEVIRRFALAGDVNKGIDIGGRKGESVLAAADGVVVYAGGGLRGYGKLVILKHDEEFLSAYGHNSKINVREGQMVKGGEKVAEIGSSGTNVDKLHFEIRRNGKPEDPMRYLPGIGS